MALIEWVIKATGEVKRARNPMPSDVAADLLAWLNTPNAASAYHLVPVSESIEHD